MFEWATALEAEGVVRLLSYRGSTGRTTLLPYLTNDDAGFLTVWNDTNGASISLWGSAERHTPELMPTIEELIAPVALGRGRTVKDVATSFSTTLADAYRRSGALHA